MRAFGRRSSSAIGDRGRAAALALFVAACCTGCGAAAESTPRTAAAPTWRSTTAPGGGHVMSPEERAYAVTLLGLTNQERVRHALPPLQWDEGAAQAALDHAVFQQWRGRIGHEGPAANDAGSRLESVGVEWESWGENVAVGYEDPAGVLIDWLASPTHRANLLAPSLTHAGIGVRAGPGGIYAGPWVTQDLFSK